VIVRNAKPQDQKAIFKIAMLMTENYPGLKPDKEEINAIIRTAISAGKHFCRVIEHESSVKAVLVCLVSKGWSQRLGGNIVLWYSEVPGGGTELLRNMKSWMSDRRAVLAIGLIPDFDMGDKPINIAKKVGFVKQGSIYTLFNNEVTHGVP
jgi:hypothetical protein